jgi:hypothetical protein
LLGWVFKSETSKATAAGAGLPRRLGALFEPADDAGRGIVALVID